MPGATLEVAGAIVKAQRVTDESCDNKTSDFDDNSRI